jgi:endonuclease-3
MTKAERAKAVLETLRPLYPDTRPPLDYQTPFQLMVAVVLSAQTTDAQVNRVTPRLFSAYPTPEALSAAPQEAIEEIVRPTGFFRAKARNIKHAAAALVDEFGGDVPDTVEELVSIPGVGRKSANAIVAALYDKPAVIVDTHFSRVCTRLGLTEAGKAEQIERELSALVSSEDQKDFSMIINFHGRDTCTARKPACEECPVRHLCPYPDFS